MERKQCKIQQDITAISLSNRAELNNKKAFKNKYKNQLNNPKNKLQL